MIKYILIDNHPADSRVTIRKDGIVQTLSSRMGTGGGNVPMVITLIEEDLLYLGQEGDSNSIRNG